MTPPPATLWVTWDRRDRVATVHPTREAAQHEARREPAMIDVVEYCPAERARWAESCLSDIDAALRVKEGSTER